MRRGIAALVGAASVPVRAARFHWATRTADGGLRINLGAGRIRLAGWLNTDRRRSPLHLDITRPWRVRPGSVSHVYGDNVIEHFPLAVGRCILRHAHAALAPGGMLRLATPDVERIAQVYLADPGALMERHRRHGYEVHHAVDILRILYATAGHADGFLWDFAALATELGAVGFVEITRCKAGESADPILRDLERRTESIEVATTLVVEARKPSA